jgi:pyruvate/2-oxoglutarate dehydrogenase complex dihydrolipoamide dehydrogenase (E3) component
MARRVVVLGGGSTGEAFAAALRKLDEEASITVVEQELLGGECTYFACMPSKTLLRSPELYFAARRAPGVAEAVTGRLDAGRIFWWRDQVVDSLDDSGHEDWLAERRIAVARGRGRVSSPGRVAVGDRELDYDRLVIATGSLPSLPPIPGLAEVEHWTNREATQVREVPESLVVIGAGPVGCELAQLFARMGSRVVLLDVVDRVLPREDPEASALLQEQLVEEGIELRLSAATELVEPGFRLTFSDGETVEAERLLVAAGRRANTDGLGLEQLGVGISERGVEVDERLRAAENVWAIGDVTGIAMFTHVGKYHGRVAAADVAGLDARADHRAIPAVTFTDPQVASVGRTQGEGLVTGRWGLPARASTYERPRRPGFLKLFADPGRGVVVGGVAVGPEAGEWLQQVTLAVRAEVPVGVLRDTIQPYPTFSEAVHFAARELPL